MKQYVVILGSGDKVLVDGQFEVSPIGALMFGNGNETTQVFAPGAWITVFKPSAIQRPDPNLFKSPSRQ